MLRRKLNRFFKQPTKIKEVKESVPTTRIEKRSETAKLLSFLQKLREKESLLAKDALKNGSDSLDYSKHTIVTTLLVDINQKVRVFNEEKPTNNEYDEIKSIVNLAQDLLNIIERIVAEHGSILQQPRDYRVKAAMHSVDVAACTVVYGAASTVGLSTLGTGFALIAAAPEISHAGKKALGLLKPTSATSLLLSDFQTSLKQMIQNLSLTLNLLKPDEASHSDNISPAPGKNGQ